MRGNQGTPFLKEVEKPFFSCVEEVLLDANIKGGCNDTVRTLQADEVLELIEGPQNQSYAPALRVRGHAVSDDAEGWFTATDKKGTIFASEGNYYICISSVSMTDGLEIIKSNVLRKLSVGEIFAVIEGPVEEKVAGAMRLKGKSLKDNAIGWITVKGVAGTVYAEVLSNHYTVLQDVPLEKTFASTDAQKLRTLMKEEVIRVLQGPKEEVCPPEIRLKGQVLSDGVVGWFTPKGNNVKAWSPYYRCTKAVSIHDGFATAQGEVLRELAVGETIELLEGPVLGGKELWMKGHAQKDGIIGWVMIRDSDGEKTLETTNILQARLQKVTA